MNGRRWTARQLATLRREYPRRSAKAVARMVGHSACSVYKCAQRLKLHKTAAFLASAASGRLRAGDGRGISGRFRSGQKAWNKGTRFIAGGRSVETQFKPGARPHTWRPIGTERTNSDGILQRKVTDTGYPPRDWRAVHTLMWEQANGPLPAGHIVIFRDGNHERLALENFECISRPELMRRNTVHNYPKPLALVIQLRGALQRQINKRARHA